MMKIAYFMGSLNRGGTETLMLDIFKHSGEASYEMIGIYRKDGTLTKQYKQSGVRLINIAPGFTGDINYILRLRKTLIREKINIIHAQQAIDAFYAILATAGMEIKIVLTFHGYNYRYGRLRNLITNWIINHTDLNIYVSKSQKDNYFDNYRIKHPEKQKVIYNGVSFEKFKNFGYFSIRNEFNIPKRSLLLGSVGNFVRVRDQLTICRFLHLLHHKNVDFYFVFAGGKNKFEPEKFDQCVNYCKEHGLEKRVFFAGSRTDVPNILSQLDAFIYSTHFDTFGIAIIEAFYMGVPVFYNNWEVFREITEDGKHGHMYKTRDENDLLYQFEDYLYNKEEYIKRAQKDAEWVSQKFNINNFLKKLEKSYLSISDNK